MGVGERMWAYKRALASVSVCGCVGVCGHMSVREHAPGCVGVCGCG